MSRATVRAGIAALFSAVFNVIYSYAPLSLQGYTKALVIYSSESRVDRISKAIENDFYVFILDVYVKRETGVNTEDALDACYEEVRSKIQANQTNALWDFLDMSRASDAVFAEVEGIPYRVEHHTISVKVTGA